MFSKMYDLIRPSNVCKIKYSHYQMLIILYQQLQYNIMDCVKCLAIGDLNKNVTNYKPQYNFLFFEFLTNFVVNLNFKLI